MILIISIVAQLLLDKSNVIFDRSNLFFDQSKIALRVFFFFYFEFHMFYHFQTFSKALSLSIRSVKHSSSIFCRFPSKFFQSFCLLRPTRPFWPFFFIYFHVSCIFFMHNGEILNLRKIWGFWWFQSFLSKLISGFLFLFLWDDINMIFVL